MNQIRPWMWALLFGGLAFVFIGYVVLVGIENSKPRFVRGDCIRNNLSVEIWEAETIFKVDAVGRRVYRSMVWLDPLSGWAPIYRSYPKIEDQRFYDLVKCPLGGSPWITPKSVDK